MAMAELPAAGSFVADNSQSAYGAYSQAQGFPAQGYSQPAGQSYAPYVASSYQPAAGSAQQYSTSGQQPNFYSQPQGSYSAQPAQGGYSAQPAQGGFSAQPPAGSYSGQSFQPAGGYGGSYGGQDTAQPYGLPSSGSFVAQQGGMPYPNAGHAGQPGFNNPFLAAMYGTLNGMGHDWATQPTPGLPVGADRGDFGSADAMPRAAQLSNRDTGADTAADPPHKEKVRDGKKRGVKDKKEQPGGFWFWSCS